MTDARPSRVERDEWRRAGQVAAGLPRAVTALALYGAKVRHAAAEGYDF